MVSTLFLLGGKAAGRTASRLPHGLRAPRDGQHLHSGCDLSHDLLVQHRRRQLHALQTPSRAGAVRAAKCQPANPTAATAIDASHDGRSGPAALAATTCPGR